MAPTFANKETDSDRCAVADEQMKQAGYKTSDQQPADDAARARHHYADGIFAPDRQENGDEPATRRGEWRTPLNVLVVP